MSRMTRVRNTAIIVFILGLLVLLVGCQLNVAPIANAGNKTTVDINSVVYLDGSMSSDPDDDPLEYQWVFSIVPEGSSPYLEDADSVYASFLPDLPGVYILELRVFDGELYSGRDHVFVKVTTDISTSEPPINPATPPIGSTPSPNLNPPGPPFPPRLIEPKTTPYIGLVSEEIFVQGSMLDITGSTVNWEIVNNPVDSQARFNIVDPNLNEIVFSSNKAGSYILHETIIHGGHAISKENFYVNIVDKRVNAGQDKFVGLKSVVDLNFAYFATLPPVDAEIMWSIIRKPELSEAIILGANDYDTQFIPDVSGTYEVSVLVTMPDGGPQDEDSIIITVSENHTDSFDHSIAEGTCVDCHNGLNTTGKSPTHIVSTENCDSCHMLLSWIPTTYVNHNELIGRCADCHNNVVAMGKHSKHTPTSDMCEACHSTAAFLPAIVVDHMEVIGTCENCHNNIIATGKSLSHINTTNKCDSCHATIRFVPAIHVDHNNVIGSCESCHNGIVANGKSVSHLPTSNNCIECHSTTYWLPIVDQNSPAVKLEGLDISLESNATAYQIGELIKATAVFTNNSNIDVELYKMSSNVSPLQIEISGITLKSIALYNPNDPAFDARVTEIIVLKSGASITREVVWDQMLPEGGLTAQGNYTLEAYVLALEPGTIQRQKIGIKADIMIEHAMPHINIESAVLTALEESTVKTWYEDTGKNITCRLNEQISTIVDYKIIPIQTLVAVPEADIQCHAELTHTTNMEWNVYFHNASSDTASTPFSYHVVIDALNGELKLGMAM